MARLEDLFRPRGFKSLRDLALKIAPSGGKLKPDYIANKVRDLDRGDDLGWWQGKGRPYLSELANELGLTESELLGEAKAWQAERTEPGDLDLWVFEMFPGLRPLDLRAEPLFPGLPKELSRPGGPRSPHTWWVALPGAGKTIYGRWLEVNFGWTRMSANRWEDVAGELPTRGRVFLELGKAEGVPAGARSALLVDLKLCIASEVGPPTAPPPEARPATASAWDTAQSRSEDEDAVYWHTVVSPPSKQWLPALVEWVWPRLASPAGFIADKVRAMVESGDLDALVETPGEALDFFGVIDEIGADESEPRGDGRRRLRWVKAWVKSALTRADRSVPCGMTEHLERSALEVLKQVERGRIRRGLKGPLTRGHWYELIPSTQAPGPDYAMLYRILVSGGPTALKEAKDALRPDAAAWVDAFMAIGLLKGSESALTVHPRWLLRIVEGLVTEELFSDVPRGIGALLLHPDTGTRALEDLVDDVRCGNFEVLNKAVAAADPADPEALVLLDAAVRAGGLNAEALPPELAGRLWDRAMDVAVQRWENLPPVPMVSASSDSRRYGELAALSTWHLAMLALSRRAGQTKRPGCSLDPWEGLSIEDEKRRLMYSLLNLPPFASANCSDTEADIARLARCLGAALLRSVGRLSQGGRVAAIQIAPVVLGLVAGTESDISAQERTHALHLECGLEALRAECESAGSDLTRVLTWCWRQWALRWRDDLPPFQWLHAGSQRHAGPEDAQVLWAHLPVELMDQDLSDLIANRPGTWTGLTEEHWRKWFSLTQEQPDFWGHYSSALASAPAQLVADALRSGAIGAHFRGVRVGVWDAMPDTIAVLVEDLAKSPPLILAGAPHGRGALSDLLWSAPEDRVEHVLGLARSWLAVPDKYPGAGPWILNWLMDVVDRQRPGWRDALALVVAHRESPP